MRVHLDGLMACCQRVIPSMRERRSGRLVAIGSISGLIGRVGQANYCAAKAATIGLMKSVAKEVGRFGLAANVILPGFIDSKMTRTVPPQLRERARADSLLGILSTPEVVASFTTWLLSDRCQGVTGQVFHLDSRIGI
jgi:3-oxoacyl-[acyl-carrier protein] reductase